MYSLMNIFVPSGGEINGLLIIALLNIIIKTMSLHPIPKKSGYWSTLEKNASMLQCQPLVMVNG